MIFRQLRIAWSTICVIAGVLMIVLWARSYWRLQILERRMGSVAVQISSVKGRLAIASVDPRATIRKSYLSVTAGDAADWRKSGIFGFRYHHDGTVTALIAPHWLAASLFAALAVLPWTSIGWRFSLRALLIVMTLVAILPGLSAAFQHPAP